MRFLFVHGWRGFSLAEWYLREAVERRLGGAVQIRSVDATSGLAPTSDLLLRMVVAWRPKLIGFSCHIWSLPAYRRAFAWLKELLPDSCIVLGGPQVSSVAAAQAVMTSHPEIDFVVRGPGEEPLCQLLPNVSQSAGWDAIPSLSHRKGAAIRHNPARTSSLDPRGAIYHPGNRLLTECLDHAFEASYETTRGCARRCSYCVYPFPEFTLVDDALVEMEISFLCRLRVDHLRIADAHFGGTAGRAKTILKQIARANRQTSTKIHPDIAHVDDEYISLVREAGAEITSIGLQTTNKNSLHAIRRHATHDHRDAIARILAAFPLVPADLIIGLPGDDAVGLERSFREVLDLGFSAVNLFRLVAFPGTPLAEDSTGLLGSEPTVWSSEGQLVRSSGFPREVQERVAALCYALEIAAPLAHLRARLKSRGEKPSRLLDLVESHSATELLEMRQAMAQNNPSALLDKWWSTVDRLARAAGLTTAQADPLRLDLIEHRRAAALATNRTAFHWTTGEHLEMVSRVHFELSDGRFASWDLGMGTVRVEYGIQLRNPGSLVIPLSPHMKSQAELP